MWKRRAGAPTSGAYVFSTFPVVHYLGLAEQARGGKECVLNCNARGAQLTRVCGTELTSKYMNPLASPESLAL